MNDENSSLIKNQIKVALISRRLQGRIFVLDISDSVYLINSAEARLSFMRGNQSLQRRPWKPGSLGAQKPPSSEEPTEVSNVEAGDEFVLEQAALPDMVQPKVACTLKGNKAVIGEESHKHPNKG